MMEGWVVQSYYSRNQYAYASFPSKPNQKQNLGKLTQNEASNQETMPTTKQQYTTIQKRKIAVKKNKDIRSRHSNISKQNSTLTKRIFIFSNLHKNL
jgi:hypothetical protein